MSNFFEWMLNNTQKFVLHGSILKASDAFCVPKLRPLPRWEGVTTLITPSTNSIIFKLMREQLQNMLCRYFVDTDKGSTESPVFGVHRLNRIPVHKISS